MKKTAKVIAVLMVAALSLGGISVCAAEAAEDAAKQERPGFSKRADAPKANFGFKFGVKEDREGGKRAELTEEEKAARTEKMKEDRKKMLDEQLSAGKITQEEYDAAIAKLEAGEFTFPGQPHWGGRNRQPGKFGGNHWKGKKAKEVQ